MRSRPAGASRTIAAIAGFLVLTGAGSPASAQRTDSAERAIMVDTSFSSNHTTTIKGQRVPYRATLGNQPVWNRDGEAVATLFYTYYERTDVRDPATRPLVISFNGGPGSASLWMHIGYTGPKVLNIDDEGYPTQPYGVRDNPHSILDVADIVYVNPVNVGFSRIIGDADREQFFGVNEDIEYLADWIDNFVGRQGRWASPKFLIGESYGTTRVSGLAGRLQSAHWMFLNGVVLVSPTGLGISRDGPVGDALSLPYYAATAWYHRQLPPDLQERDLAEVLPEVERFTIEEYIPALAHGGFIDEARKREIAERVARYSGLSVETVISHNLAVPTSFYWKDLLREEGFTVGRLDSRYRGIDRQTAGQRPDNNQELDSWNHAFAPAINHYLREILGYETDLQYYLFGPVHPWNRDGDRTGENLRQAMAENPFLHVMVQSGYFDGATDYFSAKYTLWNLDPSGRMRDRLRFEGYRSGHMMYLRKEDLATSNEHIREFIRQATPGNRPARY
jgi:carboxypeptidase C (cathepsin A)